MSNKQLVSREVELARTANHMQVYLKRLGLHRLAGEWKKGADGHMWLARSLREDGSRG
jgi:hypothetical protein